MIQIPEVGLVNASGQYIGVFEDKPDWWENVQMEINQRRRVANHRADNDNVDDDEHNAMLARRNQDMTNMSASITSLRLTGHDATQETILQEENGATEHSQGIHHNNIFKQLGSNYSLRSLQRDGELGHRRRAGDGASEYEDMESSMDCNLIGETYLHLAIMYDNLDTVKYLIETRGFDVNTRCVVNGNYTGTSEFDGGFRSRAASNLIQKSDYQSLAYYGEYPLAYAACFASKDIYDYLIEKGADPNLQGFLIVAF